MDLPPKSTLQPYLLIDPEDDKGVDFEFLSEAVRRFDEEEGLKPAIIAALEGLSEELAQKSINDDYKPYVMVRGEVGWVAPVDGLD